MEKEYDIEDIDDNRYNTDDGENTWELNDEDDPTELDFSHNYDR
jgi:hypothetical protein